MTKKTPKKTIKEEEKEPDEFPKNVQGLTKQELEAEGYELDYQEEPYISVEERFASDYQNEYEEYYADKKLEEEAVREIISKQLSMKELVEREKLRQIQTQSQIDATSSQILVMNKSFSKMEPLTVLDDSRAEMVSGGKIREIAIMHEPTVLYINMRKYWIGGGFVWKIKYFFVWLVMKLTGMMSIGQLKFNLYFIRADGEYTIDPTKDLTPWELQRKLEGFLQLKGKLLIADIKEKFISGSSDQANLMNSFKYSLIAMVIITIAFLFVMNGGAGV